MTDTEMIESPLSYQELKAQRDAELRGTQEKSLDKFLRSYPGNIREEWGNLYFTESGNARLAHTSGWFRALVQLGKKEEALLLAHDLDGILSHLNTFGGAIEVQKGINDIKFPKFRVVLSDDGTFGGWGILWHQYLSHEDWLKKAEEINALTAQTDDDWKRSVAEADEQLKIRKELELYRYYRYEKTEDDKDYWPHYTELAHYRYSFNGGLLYHGPGGDETFSMTLDGGNKNFWQTHT